VVVFFIFIVGNVGGSLTPLGDPPLFLGFLQGVSFFWTVAICARDAVHAGRCWRCSGCSTPGSTARKASARRPDARHARFGIEGVPTPLLLAAVVGLVLMSGIWKPGIEFDVAGSPVPLQALVRDGGLARWRRLAVAHAGRAREEPLRLGAHAGGGRSSSRSS
jgi:Na+/H+ antiporter NhaD/arsenite permease-like protein